MNLLHKLAASAALLTLACSTSVGVGAAGSGGAGGPDGGEEDVPVGGTGGTGGDNVGGTGGNNAGTGGDSVGSGGSGNPDTGSNPPKLTPLILSFTADPPTLPAGGGAAMLRWTVQRADSLAVDKGLGTVTGSSAMVNVTATTIFTLTATNGMGTAQSSTAVVVGQNPSSKGTRFVAMVSPTGGESFLAPATLRFLAAGRDPNIDTNMPAPGLGGNAAQVQFFVDDQMMLTVAGAQAEYWLFKGFAGPVAAGPHRVWARATYVNPELVLDSPPMLITVAEPPAYGKTVDLQADMALGPAGFSLVGTASSRARLNGHGHRIANTADTTGALTLQFVDVFDLGGTDASIPGIDVTTSGPLVIEDSKFQTTNPVRVTLNGAATASVRRNVFSSNMRTPIGQGPEGPTSFASVSFKGTSTGAKVFAGNNVGAGWVQFDRTTSWLVGGDTDADSNVLIGPRAGIFALGSTNVTVRRNYSHHVYYGGWSQGANFEIENSSLSIIEHNVVSGSSWPVRGGGKGMEFRYNLVLDAGHEWMQPAPGLSIHHNLFVGGDEDQGGLFIYQNGAPATAPPVSVYNNTFDGLKGGMIMASIRLSATVGPVTISSNAFLNYPKGPIILLETAAAAMLKADYNGFFTAVTPLYSDARSPAHDVKGTDPMLAAARTSVFDLDEVAIWNRSTTAAAVISVYRGQYKPSAGSPLIGAGDATIGAGNWIGAIGDGQPVDGFGRP
jgi:hypothetical protein